MINLQSLSTTSTALTITDWVIIDDPRYQIFADQYESINPDDEDCLIKPNHCIHTQSPHALTIKQTKEVISLIKYYNRYKIDIKIAVDKKGNITIRSHKGQIKILKRGYKGDSDTNNIIFKAIKSYTLCERFHWFNFVYFDLCRIVFLDFSQDKIELQEKIKEFRREIIDTMEPAYSFGSENHPITYLYNLVFK